MVTRVMEGARRERKEKRLPLSFLAALPLDSRSRARTTLTKSDEKATARSLVEICLFSHLITLFSFPET